MKCVWLSDVHLNFLKKSAFIGFLRTLQEHEADAVLLSGDIAEAHRVCDYLFMIDVALQTKIYFVLGNHDFYRGSIIRTRQAVAELVQDSRYLVYLTQVGVVQLTPTTCLVGHDSWADGRLGDIERSDVEMNDFYLIEELAGLDSEERRDKLRELGEEAADHLRRVLTEAVKSYRDIFVVTHVPPFREACIHEGRISDDNYLPHYSCHSAGEVLRDTATSWPDHRFTVFCGHTHSAGQVRILDNLEVYT
ncbi:MAG TPA: metallophosphoesterase, partial [bacterium]|nr:metallophosphoesterase [bacterium]